MKKLIIVLLCCLCFQINLIAQASDNNADRDGLNALLTPNEYYIVGSAINVRSKPNLNSQTLGQLKLHEKVEIVEGVRAIQKIDNIWADWYKIKYKTGYGYIWGGYIAHKALVVDMDKNGVMDYFYCRLRDVQYYISIIDVQQDIIIYINNKKISTEKLYPQKSTGCEFEIVGDKVHITVRDSSSDENKLEYNLFEVNKNGEIKFIKKVVENY